MDLYLLVMIGVICISEPKTSHTFKSAPLTYACKNKQIFFARQILNTIRSLFKASQQVSIRFPVSVPSSSTSSQCSLTER
jgi:hypothetical protein